MAVSTKVRKTKKITMNSLKNKRMMFYCIGFAIPLLQFAIFWLYLNYQSITLAFQEYNYFGDKAGQYTFAGLSNFKWFFSELQTNPGFKYAFQNGVYVYTIGLSSTIISLLCAYFVYKSFSGGMLFQVILMLPSIIPGIVLTSIFKYFVENGVSEMMAKITGEFHFGIFSGDNIMAQFWTMQFYSVWFGFAAGVLTYSSLMRGINQAIIEAAEIDGVNRFQELTKIIIPLIWPTFSTFFVMGVQSILTANCGQFLFFPSGAPKQLYTFGYWLFLQTFNGTSGTYPQISAVGVLLTCLCVPFTLFVRYLFQKYGPSAD